MKRLRLLLLLPACTPASPSTMTLSTPQALTDCAQKPEQLQARLWISGNSDPCFLDVDVDAGTTTGSCDVAPGIERRFTLDWFVDVGGREVVLAQAQKELDLSGQAEGDATLTIEDDDVKTSGCFDMTKNQFEGQETVDVDGDARPVCDLDDDGTDNITEVCAGGDPLGGA